MKVYREWRISGYKEFLVDMYPKVKSGMEETLEPKKVKSHLLSIHRYNFKKDLSDHANL